MKLVKTGSRRKLRGYFMCQSTMATAVCVSGDPSHSVIVPRRPHGAILDDDHSAASLINHGADPNIAKNSSSHRRGRRPTCFATKFDRRRSTTHGDGDKETKQKQVSSLNLSSTSSSSDHVFQVVVMRVSLHCQGCAGKVKKHLSKMEGVTSFSIDLEMKMVTVMGHVSPAGVLESLSKVKRAEFWESS